ncbi:MAG: type II toxin-antitoxin system HicB family antitoxin [Pyrinomonadaceae bacterium]
MNNTITYKGFTARVEYSSVDEVFVGRVIGIDDIIGFHCASVKELKKEMKAMIDFHLEVCSKKGIKPEKTYSGKVFLRVTPELHSRIAKTAEAKGKSINEFSAEILEKALG